MDDKELFEQAMTDESVQDETEQQAGGKVKMVTVDELRARRKAAKLEMTP